MQMLVAIPHLPVCMFIRKLTTASKWKLIQPICALTFSVPLERAASTFKKTESAVRITHIPTGIVTVCQNDRSQHRNKEQAMSQLKAKLYEAEMRKRREVQQQTEDAKSDIAWGHQIRSYVLDQSRVKDLRTNVETGNTQAVLDGDLDQFIEASLKQGV